MKKYSLKKFLALAAGAAMVLSLAACSGGSDAGSGAAQTPAQTDSASQESAPAETADTAFRIAVVKQLDHASMDEIANAITARLDEIAAETDTPIEYELFSGQNDQTVLTQIGSQVMAEGYSAVIPIGTLAAQVMVVSAEESQTPVVFAAVSDPAYNVVIGIE